MTDSTKPYEIRYTLGRREWAQTEFPALLVWIPLAGFMALGIAVKICTASGWWALTLPVWWIFLGAKAWGLLLFLALRSSVLIQITREGVLFVGEGGSTPVYAHWSGFTDQGGTYLLWGGDGRYRLVIPKRALSSDDYREIRERVGVDLPSLSMGQEALLNR